MKLLQLVEATAAGVGRHVIDLTDGLLARGHEVHLFYSDVRSDAVFNEDLRRIAVWPRFRSSRIPMSREPSAGDLSVIRALRLHVRDCGPFDLIHCHSTKAGLIGRLGATRGFGRRLYTPHGFFTMDPTRGSLARRAVTLVEAVLAKHCDGVIAVSGVEYEHAINLGISRSKLYLIPNGVANDGNGPSHRDRIDLRRSWGVRDDELCIGFVGRFVPVKSPETMLQSFATLAGRVDIPVRLVMVGDGPLSPKLRRLATHLGVESRICWLGERDGKLLMNAFDIFALTSDSEAAGLVVLEAIARGLPIVATSVGLIPQAVHPGVNGFVAPVRGVSEIAAGLEALVRDPALRDRMGRASRAVSKNFSLDRMVDQTVALYDQIVAGVWKGSASADWKVAASG
jgi:glycosyltransferase involved in cell wall biosynthesis